MPASEVLDVIVRGKDRSGKVFKDLKKGLKGVEKQASLSSRAIAKLHTGVGSVTRGLFSLKGLLATVGVSLLARSFIQAASTAEGYRTRLVTLMGDVGKANELFKKMGDFASTVSFEYEEIIGSATTLAGVMKGGTKEIEQYMPMIADLAATAGLDIQTTTSQIVRMYSAGAASADLFRERGILAMLGFTAGVSVSAEETKKRLIEAFEAPTSKFRGAADALSRTWAGMLSMMSDAWFQFRNMVMDAGVFDFIKAALSTVLEGIRALKEEGKMESFAKKMGDFVVGALIKIIQAVAIAVDGFRGLKMVWLGLKAAFALFAEFVNRGLATIYETMDSVVNAIGRSISALAKLIDAVDIWGVQKGLVESVANAGRLLEGMKGAGEEARKNAKYWYDVGAETTKVLNDTINQESSLIKVGRLLDGIKKKAAEYAAAAKDTGKRLAEQAVVLKPQASATAIMKSELLRMNELIKTNLAQMDSYYKAGLIKLTEYYDNRRVQLEKAYVAEIAMLRKAEEAQEDPSKKLAIQDKIFKTEQQYQRDTLKLLDERTKAEKEVAEQSIEIARNLAQIKGRVEFDSATDITNIFRNQQLELSKNQAEEIQKLVDMKAEENQIEEAHRLHQLERDKQVADQRAQIQTIITDNLKQSLGFMESAFSDAYAASGNTIREFYVAQKAASIANTMISTYESAQAAYKALAGIPYVGPALGVAAAAAAIIAGLARVAAIKAQSMALGGKVEGFSPSPTADNVPIRATAGEFVHPVDAVKHYGLDAMEAIRKKLVPRNLLSGFRTPYIPDMTKSYAYATGGQVGSPPNGGAGGGAGSTIEINQTNITDPRDIDRYLASARGQDSIVNLISSRALSVKRVLRVN